MVYRLRDGEVQPVSIEPGLSDSKFTEIRAGELNPGDELIVEDNRPERPAGAGNGGGGSSFKIRMF